VLVRIEYTDNFCQVKEKRLHVPLVDRIPEEPPPLIVGVVGPPGVSQLRGCYEYY
jgi:hypothetical protein